MTEPSSPLRYDRPAPKRRDAGSEPRSLRYHDASGGRPMPAGRIVLVGLIALLVGALLNADSLYATASRQDFGWQRSAARAVVTPFRSVSHLLRLNRPRADIESAIGRQSHTENTVRHGISRKPKVKITKSTPPPPIILRRPNPQDPLRVWLGGDSLTRDYGLAFQSKLGADPNFSVELDTRISTGLTRPDYFDWPAELADNVLPKKPEIMIIMFGANDAQGMELPNGVFQVGSDGWKTEYRRRVGDTMNLLAGDGRLIIWVGQPYMSDQQFSDRMAMENEIYQSEAASRPWVRYLDSRPVLSPPDKPGYAAYLPNSSGEPTLARQSDGIHLSEFGSDKLAGATIDLIHFMIQEFAPPVTAAPTTTAPGRSRPGSTTTSPP